FGFSNVTFDRLDKRNQAPLFGKKLVSTILAEFGSLTRTTFENCALLDTLRSQIKLDLSESRLHLDLFLDKIRICFLQRRHSLLGPDQKLQSHNESLLLLA